MRESDAYLHASLPPKVPRGPRFAKPLGAGLPGRRLPARAAGEILRNLSIAEISELDIQIKDGAIDSYRAKVRVSLKFEGED